MFKCNFFLSKRVGLGFLISSLDSIIIVFRFISYLQGSQALALTVSRVHIMEDVDVQLSPPVAPDDISPREVFYSLICCFLVVLFVLWFNHSFVFLDFGLTSYTWFY